MDKIYVSDIPELLKFWSPSNKASSEETTIGKDGKFLWNCGLGHEYFRTINNQKNSKGCPVCQNLILLEGFNDILTRYPKILNLLSAKNKIHPAKTCKMSTIMVWECELGHDWETSCTEILRSGRWCPYCSGNRVWIGFNDLGSKFPNLINEWSSKNENSINHYTYGSKHKAFWECKKGHEWKAPIYSRSSSGNGCPVCSGLVFVKGENDLATTFPIIFERWSSKNELSPSDYSQTSRKKIWLKCLNYDEHHWQVFVGDLTRTDKKQRSMDCIYCTNKKLLKGFNDLQTKFPNIALEYSKFNKEGPDEILHSYSHLKKWTCSNNSNHVWKASCKARTQENHDCPYCNTDRYKQYKSGDLALQYPQLKAKYSLLNKESFEETNGSLTNDFIWTDVCRHYWKRSGGTQLKSNKCPYCFTNKLLVGFNDLKSVNPTLALEWSPDNDRSPEEVTYGSNYRAEWVCDLGHKWDVPVKERIHTGCPFCSNKKVLIGFNDLASCFPKVAKEWHPTKNEDLTPQDFVYGSKQNIWFQCEKEHNWNTQIFHRTVGAKSGCPSCAITGTSKAEQKVTDYIKSLGFDIEQNTRKIITPKELDIHIPSHNIAIEYNGLHWHSEEYKPKNYHQDKFLKCHEQGIKLFQVWEDDWLYKQDVVKSMLTNLLFPDDSGDIVPASSAEASDFIADNHVSGSVGKFSLGLRRDNTLVGVVSGDSGSITGWAGNGVKRLIEAFREQYGACEWTLDLCFDVEHIKGELGEVLEPSFMFVDKDRRVSKDSGVKIFDAGRVTI